MGIRTLLKNLYYLGKYDLSGFLKSMNGNDGLSGVVLERDINIYLDAIAIELQKGKNSSGQRTILSIEETIKALRSEPVSLCRFGDGEFELIEGRSIPFQESSLELSRRLKSILSTSQDGLLVGIPAVIYSEKSSISEVSKNFWRKNAPRFNNLIKKYTKPNGIYCSAEVTLAYSLFKEYDFDDYFSSFRELWNEKSVTVVCGATVFDKIEHNIFDCAKNLGYFFVPEKDAFQKYDDIYNRLIEEDKENLIVSICGPTAKILTYDLHCAGYRALDLGHIAKAYDWYTKDRKIEQFEDAVDFFDPD